ncbi:MAG: T9SS type B sorting domain-containing protein, partial [Sphingobacteriales bacterium]
DFWRIPFLSFFPDAHITIFDRYGKVITAFNGKDKGWDGTYNGEALPSTDYWFMLTFTTGRTIKGHFSMLR